MSMLVPQGFFETPRFPSLWQDDWFRQTSGVNVTEDDNHIIVEAAVPGVDPAKLQVTFQRGVLQVSSRREEKDEQGARSWSALSYRINVPGDMDEDAEPEARYENGLLKIAFAKAEAAQPKQITVKKG